MSFVVKKTKWEEFYFLSFMILIFPLTIGVVGFVIILFAAIMALKKRRY